MLKIKSLKIAIKATNLNSEIIKNIKVMIITGILTNFRKRTFKKSIWRFYCIQIKSHPLLQWGLQ